MRLIVVVSALLALLAVAPVTAAQWQENATRTFYDSEKRTRWRHAGGDFLDATGAPIGDRPYLSRFVGREDVGRPIVLDVTSYVRAHGADFRFSSVRGQIEFRSREAKTGAPTLSVTRGGVTRVLPAAADVTLSATAKKPLGKLTHLSARDAFLVRFDQPADPAITNAELQLTPRQTYDKPRLVLFRPTPGVGARVVATQAPPPRTGPARVLREWTGNTFKPRDNRVVENGIVTAWLEGESKTMLQPIYRLRAAPEEAYLTVVLKLHADWPRAGGKLPGLSNTGQLRDAKCSVDGVEVAKGGWGGRSANGCRWSARTAWFENDGGATVPGGTYFYALQPRNPHGVRNRWALPMPKGRWFAYVQRVRLNTPGSADGAIGYWLIADGEAHGGRMVQESKRIVWRRTRDPGSRINEVWVNVFCGGSTCGPKPYPRSTVSIRRLTVTDALPDMGAIQAEIDRLNAGRV